MLLDGGAIATMAAAPRISSPVHLIRKFRLHRPPGPDQFGVRVLLADTEVRGQRCSS